MQTLDTFFAESGSRDIFALGQYIQRHVDDQWEAMFRQTRQEMIDRYDEIGDSVYAIYGNHLFKPVHEQLRLSGLRAKPKMPGSIGISREWGDDESDRQRWFWSRIVTADGADFGTIATAFYHSHTEVMIPRAFRIIALPEVTKSDVIGALSALSEDFAKAMDANAEYAAYLREMSEEVRQPL